MNFNRNSTVYITRISPTSASSAQKDYKTFLSDLRWDNTPHNHIQVSDFLGFIVDDDETKSKKVKIHKVIRVGSVEQRHETWNSNTPCNNNNNGKHSPGHRKPIYLSRELRSFPWTWWKQTVQYAPKCAWWMPQGTMKSRNPLRISAPEGLKYAVDEKEYRETYFGYEEVPEEENHPVSGEMKRN